MSDFIPCLTVQFPLEPPAPSSCSFMPTSMKNPVLIIGLVVGIVGGIAISRLFGRRLLCFLRSKWEKLGPLISLAGRLNTTPTAAPEPIANSMQAAPAANSLALQRRNRAQPQPSAVTRAMQIPAAQPTSMPAQNDGISFYETTTRDRTFLAPSSQTQKGFAANQSVSKALRINQSCD